jgi:hypothetical protein
MAAKKVLVPMGILSGSARPQCKRSNGRQGKDPVLDAKNQIDRVGRKVVECNLVDN